MRHISKRFNLVIIVLLNGQRSPALGASVLTLLVFVVDPCAEGCSGSDFLVKDRASRCSIPAAVSVALDCFQLRWSFIAPLICQYDAIPPRKGRLITTEQFWNKTQKR